MRLCTYKKLGRFLVWKNWPVGFLNFENFTSCFLKNPKTSQVFLIGLFLIRTERVYHLELLLWFNLCQFWIDVYSLSHVFLSNESWNKSLIIFLSIFRILFCFLHYHKIRTGNLFTFYSMRMTAIITQPFKYNRGCQLDDIPS